MRRREVVRALRFVHGADAEILELEGEDGRYHRVKEPAAPELPMPLWNIALLALPAAVILVAFLAFCGVFLLGNLALLGVALKGLFT